MGRGGAADGRVQRQGRVGFGPSRTGRRRRLPRVLRQRASRAGGELLLYI